VKKVGYLGVSPEQTKCNLQDSGAKSCWIVASSDCERNAENKYEDLIKGYMAYEV
jgi:hypothetical protein